MKPKAVGLHYGSVWVAPEFVEQVVSDIKRKAMLVHAGIDDFTPAEKLAFYVLEANHHI
jgi:hypothetical protein